jgi:uncharacterized membrane protein
MANRRSPYRLWDPRRAVGRFFISAVLGALTWVALSLRFSFSIALLGAWNLSGLVLGALAWRSINQCDAKRTQQRAAEDDPGRTAVYAVVVCASVVSLLAATVLVRHPQHANVGAGEMQLLMALCVITVTLSWMLSHTAFTLRYAHLYYREDAEGVGGIDFAGGGKPTYTDFAYLAFTVGMCFQVSDTAITSRQIRGAVLFHAALSFFYNTAILAFVLNLVFGHAG